MNYLWLKSFHIISLVAWFAGLFYIFRLFVYHVKFRDQSEVSTAYTLMEWRLIYLVTHPAMLLTLLSGFLLVTVNPSVLRAPWFHAKMGLVLLLIAYQIFAGITHARFARGNFFLSERLCRIINEVPTLLLIGIVILAVVKPL